MEQKDTKKFGFKRFEGPIKLSTIAAFSQI